MGADRIRFAHRVICIERVITLVSVAVMVSGCAFQPSTIVRVLSYNIHHGEGTDGIVDLERLARVIDSVDPDLVAIQEVDRFLERSGGSDQAAEVARLTGMHHAFGKAIGMGKGEYGVMVLSRWPIVRRTNHALPASPQREPRTAMAVEVDQGGTPLRFICTHLDHTRDPTDRQMQIGVINAYFARDDEPPTILAGDLNAMPQTAEMRAVVAHWIDTGAASPAPTSPSQMPKRRIDYVLARPKGRWCVVESRVLPAPVASDHRPLFTILRFTP